MEVKTVSINKIKPYENNPRNNDDAVDAVANSIKEFGWQQPIVVDIDGVIIAGHTRYKAAKKLGYKEVPIVVADNLTEEQVNAYRLADNKSGELATWDDDELQEELDKILDIDMTDFGFDLETELEDDEVIDDDYEEEVPEEPKSKLGQVYQLGRHRLMCGDSTKPEDVKKLMNGVQADLLITDPPYNVDYSSKDFGRTEISKTRKNNDIANDKMENEQFMQFLVQAFSNASVNMKLGASFYIWFSDLATVQFNEAAKESGLNVKETLIWVKNNFVLGRQDYQHKHEPCLYGWVDGGSHSWYSDRKQTTILNFDKPQRSGLHPTMKPIPLFDYQIKNSSKSGDIVLDLFGGSGTTLMACEQDGRNAYLMEFDPRYVDVIIDRWEKFTGKTAKLIQE
ncbi:DNA modification methylase [Lactobacillus hominis]|uniref:Methyltransferase n=1 Tax=Lactobacillus hominis DSM 23910 = CRBIP 24.179 TaxID=1423758 RepID=I7L6H2_9LACO|nr:DNA modification methylase [Lactobacillus hominis]KRM85763.1 adenine methyltransferase [Lactobacillus hominis DSM 23910 = CRBIP 24.179]MCT3347190.1 site-specific DNA-methyltransferase [Lactobacillus hominis]CCI82002.1 Putative adenine methyltransferase [Lactobacillus hominis DSM 23910 = CRBIP 24.179]